MLFRSKLTFLSYFYLFPIKYWEILWNAVSTNLSLHATKISSLYLLYSIYGSPWYVQNCEYLAILTSKNRFCGYEPETLTDPQKVVQVYTIGSIFDITTHPQLNPISMVKMIGSRWAPNLPILSDFDCLQPRRRFLRYFFENHMGFGDYQDELACPFSKVYLKYKPFY